MTLRTGRGCFGVVALASAVLAAAANGQAPPDPGVPAVPPAPAAAPARSHVPGELIVRYRRGVDSSEQRRVASRLDGSVDRRVGRSAYTKVVELEAGETVAAAVRDFEREDEVVYAEPNYYLESYAVPNDPELGRLWGLRNTGQSGVAGADIDAVKAWDLTQGNASVVVAVVDTGVDLDHPDLAQNIWTNAGETGSGRETNGVDDDGNGKVDDWRGWDFADEDNEPDDGNAAHGTHVAGTIGAKGNNGIGVAGVAWNVRLMPIRVLADDPVSGAAGGTSESIANGMAYAAANGARIVNLSLGGRFDTVPQVQLDAIRSGPDTLWVVAAGNEGSDNDAAPVYPCNFSVTEANVVCVAATDSEDELAGFSNYGRKTVQIAAPGKSIFSTSPRSQVQDDFETSTPGRWVKYSAPHASGAPVPDSWARTNEAAASGSHSWTDTPGTGYPAPMNSGFMHPYWFSTMLEKPNNACYLDFRLAQQVGGGVYETPFHVLKIDMASDKVPYWNTTELLQLSSIGTGWQHLNLPLAPIYWNSPRVALRFRFEVGFGASSGGGVWIDDVKLWCGDPDGAPLPSYRSENGTSMAAPHVSGAAALLAAHRPGLSAAELRATLVASAEGAGGSLEGKVGACRRLNVHRALLHPATTAAAACPKAAVVPQGPVTGDTTGTVKPETPPAPPPTLKETKPFKLVAGKRGTARLTPGLEATCPAGGQACTGTYVLRGKVPAKRRGGRRRAKTVILAKGSFAVAAGATRNPTITLDRKARRLLAHHRRLAGTLEVELATADRRTTSATKKLSLRRIGG